MSYKTHNAGLSCMPRSFVTGKDGLTYLLVSEGVGKDAVIVGKRCLDKVMDNCITPFELDELSLEEKTKICKWYNSQAIIAMRAGMKKPETSKSEGSDIEYLDMDEVKSA